MGKVFKHVADGALHGVPHEICQQCERSTAAVYGYTGEILDPHLAADVQLALEEPQVHFLCAECIHGGNVRRTDRAAVEHTVERLATDSEKVWREFNHLPDMPLFLQGRFDWPLCCGSWCEFTGSPADFQALLGMQASHQYWEGGPAGNPRPFHVQGPPESLREISAFACCSCNSRYYTDQCT